MADLDVVLSPTLGEDPPALGVLNFQANGSDLAQWSARGYAFAPFVGPRTSSGQPAASCPVAVNARRLPVGVQLAAAPGEDLLVLQLAHQIERVRRTGRRRSAACSTGSADTAPRKCASAGASWPSAPPARGRAPRPERHGPGDGSRPSSVSAGGGGARWPRRRRRSTGPRRSSGFSAAVKVVASIARNSTSSPARGPAPARRHDQREMPLGAQRRSRRSAARPPGRALRGEERPGRGSRGPSRSRLAIRLLLSTLVLLACRSRRSTRSATGVSASPRSARRAGSRGASTGFRAARDHQRAVLADGGAERALGGRGGRARGVPGDGPDHLDRGARTLERRGPWRPTPTRPTPAPAGPA